MKTYFLDIEANGLLLDATDVWCVVVSNGTATRTFTPFKNPEHLVELQSILDKADRIVGHNIMMYDLPCLKRLYNVKYDFTKVVDTILISRALLPDRENGHSLNAWGQRLGVHKSEFNDFSQYSEEMVAYCIQDVVVTEKLYNHLISEVDINATFITIEHKFAYLINQQIMAGFTLDVDGAKKLYDELNIEYQVLREKLSSLMPAQKDLTHYKTVIKKGALLSENDTSYTYTSNKKVVTKEFKFTDPNPTSRLQLIAYFKELGWVPKEFTEAGQPEINEKILDSIGTESSAIAARMFRLQKQIGMINDGQYAWIKCVNHRTGRVHGDVITNGANTSRCTHSKPNLAQVDKKDLRMRDLWKPREGFKLVGCDAASLELRVLGHYLSFYDKGLFAIEVESGDVHTRNKDLAGLAKRDSAKTMIYALVYGAGNAKLGKIKADDMGVAERDPVKLMRLGTQLRHTIEEQFTGYSELLKDVQNVFLKRKYLNGLDGRPLHPRKEYSALNLLIQSAGAIIMKQALINSYELYTKEGFVLGTDYNYVGNIHDEAQIECRPEIAEKIGSLFRDGIIKAGEDFKMRCKMDGEYKVGNSWKETH
jgi:DNA polymerase-1